ncbi:MAG: hypothetical protein IJB64_10675 [Akkermansia sp.]|nr:hypothetical protein [Akkermansia sp.]
MKHPFVTLLLLSTLCCGQEEASFYTTQVTIAPQAPQWAPPVTDDEGAPLAPCSIELSASIDNSNLNNPDFPPVTEHILCNIRFKGSLTDGAKFSATNPTIYNNGNSIGLSFQSPTIPKSGKLRLKGTLSYEIRTGAETEKTPTVAIKGRGEYKTAGYIIHYLPDAGEGTKKHTFMVMPPDRTKESSKAIVDIIFTDKNGKVWSRSNDSLAKEEVWYTPDSVCFCSEEKIEVDHGSLQIVLCGKAKTYTTAVNQSVNLIPSTPPPTPKVKAQQVQLSHIETEISPTPHADTENALRMSWQQCHSSLLQETRMLWEEQGKGFKITEARFDGAVTDENGCKLPLKAGFVGYTPDDGFEAELINKDSAPTGLKLHVKGTLEFTVCSLCETKALPPVTVRKGSSTQCGVFTIEYFSKKSEGTEDVDYIRVSVDAAHAEKLSSLHNIKVIGTDSVSRDFNAPDSILFCVFSEVQDEHLPDELEVSLLLLTGGQRCSCTIDQVVDLSKDK